MSTLPVQLSPEPCDHQQLATVWQEMRGRTDWQPDPVGPRDPNRPLRRVFAVGGYAVSPDRLCYRDEFWLATMFRYLRENGMKLGPQPEIFAPNLVNGEDVLDPMFRETLAMRPDILLIAAVPTPSFAEQLRRAGVSQAASRTSPHERPGAWRAAAESLGVQLIITCGRKREDFEGEMHKEIDGRDFIVDDDPIWVSVGRYEGIAPANSMAWAGGVPFQMDVIRQREFAGLEPRTA